MNSPMSSKQVQPNAAFSEVNAGAPFFREELPLTVREAATYLGVSVQTVYLWVERKQIPHLRVMGSKYPFLASGSRAIPRDLQTRGGRWQDLESTTVLSTNEAAPAFSG
jgi:excisionase family DNA binding protein